MANLDLRRHLPSTAFVVLLLAVLAGVAGIFVYLGVYNIAADAPHGLPSPPNSKIPALDGSHCHLPHSVVLVQ